LAERGIEGVRVGTEEEMREERAAGWALNYQ
jgi:hypothetical protein